MSAEVEVTAAAVVAAVVVVVLVAVAVVVTVVVVVAVESEAVERITIVETVAKIDTRHAELVVTEKAPFEN